MSANSKVVKKEKCPFQWTWFIFVVGEVALLCVAILAMLGVKFY